MLGFYSISEQAASGSSGGGTGSAGRGGGSGGGRFGGNTGRSGRGGGASPKGHKHRRHIDFSPLPPEYWQVREAYLKRKKEEEEGDLPQN